MIGRAAAGVKGLGVHVADKRNPRSKAVLIGSFDGHSERLSLLDHGLYLEYELAQLLSYNFLEVLHLHRDQVDKLDFLLNFADPLELI